MKVLKNFLYFEPATGDIRDCTYHISSATFLIDYTTSTSVSKFHRRVSSQFGGKTNRWNFLVDDKQHEE